MRLGLGSCDWGRGAAVLALLVAAAPAFAEDPDLAELQRQQVEQLRSEIAGQIQLQAFDLVDELVYGWTVDPVFATPTSVVLADVNVPVGFGSGLQALIETHFASVVTKNPSTRVLLSHCPSCTSLLVHSGKEGTIVSRGVDQPEALMKVSAESGSLHALFLDFEAEGAALVLRARITSLKPSLPIVYARTLSTSTSSPALLRTGDQLKSAPAARQEYLDALRERGTLLVPARFGVRTYAQPDDPNMQVAQLPYLWLQVGAEIALSQARAWTASASLGVTYFPQVHSGWSVQGKVARLLTGNTHSLTRPDLYGFIGGSMITIYGNGANTFRSETPTVDQITAAANNPNAVPQFSFAAFQIGLDLRVKNRIGVGAFLESAPALDTAKAVGTYLDFILKFQAIGVEVSVCF